MKITIIRDENHTSLSYESAFRYGSSYKNFGQSFVVVTAVASALTLLLSAFIGLA